VDGFGGEAGSKDACLLFNALHSEEPVRLLAEAARVVQPGGVVLVLGCTNHRHMGRRVKARGLQQVCRPRALTRRSR
jgi:hypothetical protein